MEVNATGGYVCPVILGPTWKMVFLNKETDHTPLGSKRRLLGAGRRKGQWTTGFKNNKFP